MNNFRNLFKKRNLTAVISAALVFAVSSGALSTSAMAAPVYKDVPGTHWAHASISAVADRGLVVGDASANFKPNDLLNKFDTSKILAKAAGYKYDNLSQAEQDYYNKCYDKNKGLLAQYSTAFKKWSTSADREIAFLLEKEILTVSDLDQFVILRDNTEQLRALSRGELAVFLVKLLGKNAEAQSYVITDSVKFKDDAKITETFRKHVYYAKSLGIFTGDTNGNFDYDAAVTKAVMAVTLDKALGLTAAATAPVVTTTPTPAPSGAVSNITTVAGTFDKYFPALDAIQIIASGSDKKEIYKLSASAGIYVDSFLKTVSDLSPGMVVVCVTNNGEIVNLQAESSNKVSTMDPSPTPSGTIQYSTVEGTVSSAEATTATRLINIEVKMLNPRDNSVISDIKSYALASDCKIYRGGAQVSFADIAHGDIITAEVSGSMAYKISLEERSVVIKEGTLLEKQYNDTTGVVTLVVSGDKEKIYNLRVTSTSTMARKNVTGTVTWEDLRIGDTVDVTAEYSSLQSIMAYGIISTVDGWIDEISIGRNAAYLNLRGADGKTNKYYLIKHATDPYSLRVGDKVRLRLDSKEISTVMLLEEASTTTVTGYIASVKSGIISLRDTQPYGTTGKRDIYLDSNTTYMNSKTGEKVKYSALSVGQKVYIVCKNVLSNDAKSVTILLD